MNFLPNTPYGTYWSGNEKFFDKSEALLHASQHGTQVRWDFHDDVFGQLDWTQRPPGTIDQLYRMRAQQIRDNYDYVVVHFSGGADSWTVLDSFLSNNIHVDEVYTRWAFQENKYKTPNNQDFREYNIHSEYDYAAKPVLEEIQKTHPQTRIYVDDYSDAYERDLDETTFVRGGGRFFCKGTFHRFSRKSPWEIQAARQGKRVAVVYGFDKIGFSWHNRRFYAYFEDKSGGADYDPERSVEFFYWSRDLPQIPILCAHLLKDHVTNNPPQDLQIFDDRSNYIQACYPRYNLNTFQVMKNAGTEFYASELWVRKHNPRYYQSWQWNIEQYVKRIDDRFLRTYDNRIRLGYRIFRSQVYDVGNIDLDSTYGGWN